MLTLKIGQNHMLINNSDGGNRISYDKDIIYMMSCFDKKNKVVIPLSSFEAIRAFLMHSAKYQQEVNKLNLTELYFLIDNKNLDLTVPGRECLYMKKELFGCIKQVFANQKTYTVDISKKFNSKRYKIGETVFNIYRQDPTNLLSHLSDLGNYKESIQKIEEIKSKLTALDTQYKKLNQKQEESTEEYLDEKGFNCLKLIDRVDLTNKEILLTIKPLNLNPSESFSNCVPEEEFLRNDFIFKVEKALRTGGHFRMPGTQISIDDTFKPKFIQVLDKRFEDFLDWNNYFHIGYVHFGNTGICGGEFNDAIANARSYGIEYYLIAFKQYITTGNIRDIAGIKIWRYPIFDDEGHIMYWAALDMLRQGLIQKLWNILITDQDIEAIKNMSWDDFFKFCIDKNISFKRLNKDIGVKLSTNNGKDNFIEACRTKDPQIYELLMEGAN